MANPSTDDGFLMISHELFAALACADFTKWEWVILREVFDQIYGRHRLEAARVSPTEIAGRLGTSRPTVGRSLGYLVQSGTLVRESPSVYRFVEDYEMWTDRKGNRRLSPTAVAYCLAAKPHRKPLGRPKKQGLPRRPADYAEYLLSDHWQRIRQSALWMAGGRCQACNRDKYLEVHHRTYERLGQEEPGDLMVLCRDCHEIFHLNGRIAK